eukprot:36590_1
MTTSHLHEFVELQCIDEFSKKQSVKLVLPSSNDWTLNLQSLLKRIPKKFKCLLDIDKSQWILTINNQIINKQDPIYFGKLLSEHIAPPAIIKIVQPQAVTKPVLFVGDEYHLKINYKSSSMIWRPKIENPDWDSSYNDLIRKITTHFQIYNKINFKCYDNDDCEVMDGDDLEAVWDSLIANKNRKIENVQIIELLNEQEEILNKSSRDINDVTDELLNDMKDNVILELQFAMNMNQTDSKQTNFEMDWTKACNGIDHEMWPKLSNTIRAIVNGKDTNIRQ